MSPTFPTEAQNEEARKVIALARKELAKEDRDPTLAAGFLRDCELIRLAGLWGMAYDLNHARYGCSSNDVVGLIENLEQFINGERELPDQPMADNWR